MAGKDNTLLMVGIGLAIAALATGGYFAVSAYQRDNPPADLKALFDQADAANGLPAGLTQSVAWTESRYDPRAVSDAGAEGVMQLEPQYYPGVDPFNPAQAVPAAAASLAQYFRQFGSWTLAVAAYNAGPGEVVKHGNQVPPFPETQAYVTDVLGPLGLA